MKVSIERKRAILDSAKGQFFSVEFLKKDGSVRQMVAKKWIENAFTYGSKEARPNTVAHIDKYYTAADMDLYKSDPKKSFRNIDLTGLKSAKIAGVLYTFND